MKIKKYVIYCFTTSLVLLWISGVFGTDYFVYASEMTCYNENTDVVINAEETEWRFRVVDGRLQKRLWSITYNRWLTDWQWV